VHAITSLLLPSTSEPAASARAVLALGAATALGAKAGDSGVVVTLAASSVLANLGLAPVVHPIYDLCWSTFLPASLVFLLLSLRKDDDGGGAGARAAISGSRKDDSSSAALSAVVGLALPFALAAFGSICGCVASFFLARRRYPGIGLTGPDALISAACLTASFIGGSVNFFATAALVCEAEAAAATPPIVASMAAADLVVMAVYFACLGSMARSRRLRLWFEGRGGAKDAESRPISGIGERSSRQEASEPASGCTQLPLRAATGTIAALGFAVVVVRLSRALEQVFAAFVPGTACAIIAAIVPATKFLPRGNRIWNDVRGVSSGLSNISFLLLFAAIGTSADLSAAFREGPACLVFSLVALAVHLFLVLFLSKAFRRVRSIRLEEVLIASNAAIGGPATAATFCGQLLQESSQKEGLTMAATVWGVVGYAAGTIIGVSLYRVLSRLNF